MPSFPSSQVLVRAGRELVKARCLDDHSSIFDDCVASKAERFSPESKSGNGCLTCISDQLHHLGGKKGKSLMSVSCGVNATFEQMRFHHRGIGRVAEGCKDPGMITEWAIS
jgi:hypothetical protein